jgi:hypothetical protein
MNERLLWIGGLAAAAASAVGVGIYMSNKSAVAAAAASGGTAASTGTTPTGSNSLGIYYVVLNADGTTSPPSPAPAAGQTVQFFSPIGSNGWGDNSAAAASGAANGLTSISIPSSGYNNATLVYSGTPATANIAITWIDANGTSHTNNVTLT